MLKVAKLKRSVICNQSRLVKKYHRRVAKR